MNVGVNFEPVGKKLFNTNPFSVAFKRSTDEGFVALAATNRLLRVTLNDDGSPTINPPLNAADPGNIVRIELKDPAEIGQLDEDDTIGGKNPRGLVLNSTDTRAYVMDFLSRDIAVVDVSGDDPALYKTLARVQSADLPAPDTDAAIVQRGKYLFNTAIGPVGTQPNSVRPSGRMSDTGWGTCYSCHPSGLTDTVTWMFADGPRQAISMESTFEFGAAKIVNGVPAAARFAPARAELVGRPRRSTGLHPQRPRRVRRRRAGQDRRQWRRRSGRRRGPCAASRPAPDREYRPERGSRRHCDLSGARRARADLAGPQPQLGAQIGRVIFEVQGCQNCHGGKNWTISALDYTPPPVADRRRRRAAGQVPLSRRHVRSRRCSPTA